MKNYPTHRVGIFVDVQNIYHSAKHLYQARVNFQSLIETLAARRSIVRAFAYVVKSDVVPGEESFFEALEKAGFELRTKELQVFADGTKKGDWDVGIAIDAVRTAASVDTVILITGDGDFVPLIEYLRNLGKRVEVAAISRAASGRLRDAADEFTEIELIPKIFIPINQKRLGRERTGPSDTPPRRGRRPFRSPRRPHPST